MMPDEGADQEAIAEGAVATVLALFVAHRATAYLTRRYGQKTAAKFWTASLLSQLGGIGLFFAGWFWNPLYDRLLTGDSSGWWLALVALLIAAPYPVAYVLAAKQYRWIRRTRGPQYRKAARELARIVLRYCR